MATPWTPGHIRGPSLLSEFYMTLIGLTFPAYPDTQRPAPPVWYMGTSPDWEGTRGDPPDEYINLEGVITDGVLEWAQTGRIQTEELTVTVSIQSYVPGVSGPEASDRVDALSVVIQDGFRDPATGLPRGMPNVNVQNFRIAEYEYTPQDLDSGVGMLATFGFRFEVRH